MIKYSLLLKCFIHYDLSVLIGPPTAPERFMYTERTKSSITLDWKPPRSDGGSPILGYIVEKRRHDSKDYERVNARLCPKTSLLVEKLDELHMYEFRVKAVNAIGESEPSLPLNVVIQDDEGISALKKSIQRFTEHYRTISLFCLPLHAVIFLLIFSASNCYITLGCERRYYQSEGRRTSKYPC